MSVKLENLRKQIDRLDVKLLHILAKRAEIVRKIGNLKKEQGLKTVDEKRWDEVFSSNIKNAQNLGLSQKMVKSMLLIIHKYSVEIQED